MGLQSTVKHVYAVSMRAGLCTERKESRKITPTAHLYGTGGTWAAPHAKHANNAHTHTNTVNV